MTASSGPMRAVSGEPDRVGRYVIERRIGAGAMGVVYAARDPELERPVAIKVLRSGASSDRLKREAQLLARLHHPNVVAVFDVGEHHGQNFVAMALVDGENLRGWLARPHSVDEALRVIRDTARGLAAAHAAGVIHRDLKPDNIFIARDGAVQVGDFGLARSSDDDDVVGGPERSLELTQTGMVLGTPAYMAPEHAEGEPTEASDQFSLCVTAWEALYGKRPFAAKTWVDLRDAIVDGQLAPTPESVRVPGRVRAALERGLRADPAARFPSIEALIDALRPPRRHWPWVAAGVAVLAIVAAAVAITKRAAGPQCEATAHELDDTWGAAQRERLAVPARELVDGYAHDWLALRREVCLAPRDGDDARVRCLDRARDTLRSLIGDVDAKTDPDTLHEAVLALPPVGDCRTALDGTASAAQREAGEKLMLKIDRAGLTVELGGPGTLPAIRALADQAKQLAYEPAIVSAAVLEARAHQKAAQPEAAEAVLREALSHAEASHDDRLVALVAAKLAPIAIGLDKLDEARAMIDLATATSHRAGADPEVQLALIDARAQIAAATGDHAAAIDLIKQVLGPMERRTGAGSVEVMELYTMLARECSAAGRAEETRDALEHARAAAVQGLKGRSELDVLTLSQKFNAALVVGDTEQALQQAQRLEAVGVELHEPGVIEAAAESVARAYEMRDDARMMIASFGHLLELLDHDADGGDAEHRAIALEGVGLGWLGLHDPARAIEPLRKAVDIYAKIAPPADDNRASTTIELAQALEDTGKPHEARGLLEPVLRALSDDPKVLAHRRGSAEFQLARALWDDGDAHDRAHARTLAAAATRDYQAAIERAKAPGGYAMAAPRFGKRLDDIAAWLARRQDH